MAGKGSKWRKGTNLKLYWNNYPVISKQESTAIKIETKQGKTRYIYR